MKKRNGVLALLLLLVSVLAWYPTPVLAGGPDGSTGASPESEVPFGQVARYLATYMNSQTGTGVRSATVVSVTNQGLTTCGVSVDWRRGFDPGIISCTTNLNLAPGVTADYCSRPLPGAVTTCNSTCPFAGLTFHEGNARIASTSSGVFPQSTCNRIAVSARVYYFSTSSDVVPSAITDSNIVRINSGNAGD